MAGGRPLLEQQAPQLVARILQQVGRTEVAGHENGVVRQFALARPVAGEDSQEPVGEVLEVVQPLLDVGVSRLGEAGAMLVTHAVDGRLGGQAGADRLDQRAVPAAIVGEHAVGLENLERGPGQPALPAFQHLVDVGLQPDQRLVQAHLLGLGVLGQQVLRRHRRLVQDDMAEGQAFREALALQALGTMRRDLDVAQFLLAQKLARGDGLGQHHGDGLDVLDLVLVVAPLGAVLDDQHPDRAAAAQQRGAEEGVVGILAGLGPVGEAGMRGRVGQADRLRRARHLADQALARPQARLVHRLGLQALGGEQLQLSGGAAQVDRTDLRHHRLGDDADDRVQPLLGRSRPRHSLADLAKEVPRPPRRQSASRHGLSSIAHPRWAQQSLFARRFPVRRPRAGRAPPVRRRRRRSAR